MVFEVEQFGDALSRTGDLVPRKRGSWMAMMARVWDPAGGSPPLGS